MWLKFISEALKEDVNENIDKKTTIDDFSQFAPMATVYILNSAGIKGKNEVLNLEYLLQLYT